MVAVLDCSKVDASELARISGGAQYLHLIEVPYMFAEVSAFRDALLEELRDLDLGEDPEVVVRAASDEVVTVEPGDPLFWWGYDADGNVVAGAALGDVENAEYQVFTCAP